MPDKEFDPARAERLILNLRIENRRLKSRLREIDRLTPQELPSSWQKTLTSLRRENSRFRIERNQALAELAALRAELEARGE